jgi:hypothetical protein
LGTTDSAGAASTTDFVAASKFAGATDLIGYQIRQHQIRQHQTHQHQTHQHQTYQHQIHRLPLMQWVASTGIGEDAAVAGRGRKLGIGFVVLVVLLLGGLVVADRLAAQAAAKQVAQQAQKELVARQIKADSPTATISGFPFLTQVLGGVYQKITIKVDQPEANGVKLRDITVVATSVHADAQAVLKGVGTVTADKVAGTANLDWDAVRGLIQLAKLPNIDPKAIKLSVVNNQVEVRLPLNLPGDQPVTLKATGALQVADGKVRIKLGGLTTEGARLSPLLETLVRNYIQQHGDSLVATINVPAMPYQLVIDKVETSDAGVLVKASADNVRLAG